MDLADGHGGLVHIMPNETKVVRGDLSYFRRAAKDIGGLVVKPAPSSVKRADHDRSPGVMMNDVHKVRISNYRDIPMRLATGVDRQYVELPRSKVVEDKKGKKIKVPGTATCTARVSLIKQMTSIKVEILDEDESKPTNAQLDAQARAEDRKERAEAARETLPKHRSESDLNVPKTSEPPAADLESLRQKFECPSTREAFLERAKQITWHDLRGMCGELGFSRPQSRDHAVELIASNLYPEPVEDEDGDDDSDEKASKKTSRKGSKKK
jgi:hypothetical protein